MVPATSLDMVPATKFGQAARLGAWIWCQPPNLDKRRGWANARMMMASVITIDELNANLAEFIGMLLQGGDLPP